MTLTNRSAKGMAHASMYARSNYTLCPAGDTPESRRIYHALEHGSVPLLPRSFHPPPMANWSEFSAPIAIDPASRALVLPDAASYARLRGGVVAHARSFVCAPDNQQFTEYLQTGFQAIAKSKHIGFSHSYLTTR